MAGSPHCHYVLSVIGQCLYLKLSRCANSFHWCSSKLLYVYPAMVHKHSWSWQDKPSKEKWWRATLDTSRCGLVSHSQWASPGCAREQHWCNAVPNCSCHYSGRLFHLSQDHHQGLGCAPSCIFTVLGEPPQQVKQCFSDLACRWWMNFKEQNGAGWKNLQQTLVWNHYVQWYVLSCILVVRLGGCHSGCLWQHVQK